MSDPVLAALGFGLVLAILGLVTVVGRVAGLGQEANRKLVHIGVGHWILLAVAIEDWRWAVAAPVVFVGLNYLSHRKGTFAVMERAGAAGSGDADAASEPDTLGTVYYSVSLAVVVAVLWQGGQPRWIGVAAIGVMAWGDGLAAVVGQRWGRRRFRVLGATKSLQGSLAMLLASLAVVLACQRWGGAGIEIGTAAIVAVIATVLEACSPRGLDNLTVPLGTMGLLLAL